MSAPRGTVTLPVGWPLLAVLSGYPVAWLLGVKLFAWPLMGLLLAYWLVTHRSSLRAPMGFGLWLLFLVWTVLSAFMLDGFDRLAAWTYRESMYVTATVTFLFLVNVSRRELPTRKLAVAVISLFGGSVVLGTLGILFPDVVLPTLADKVLPASLTNIDFIEDQLEARLGGTAEFLQAVRPAAPYGYTNEWGAAMGVLLPLTLYSSRFLRTAAARRVTWSLVAAATVPIVVSVNRGLWASVIIAVLVVALRAALAQRLALLSGVSAGMAVVGLLILVTPLRFVIAQRLERPNLDTRQTLIDGAITLARDSPLFGFGAPVEVTTIANTNDVSIGTHGQLWTLLVSHGVPSVLFYIGFFVVLLALTWNVRGWALWPWAAVVVSLVQMPFYNSLPVPLILAMIGIVLCLRSFDDADLKETSVTQPGASSRTASVTK